MLNNKKYIQISFTYLNDDVSQVKWWSC